MKTQINQGVVQPFWHAYHAAIQITSKDPDFKQPESFKLLEEALAILSPEEQGRLVFFLSKKVLMDGLHVQPLFAVAKSAHLMGVAYATTTIKKAQETGLTFEDLTNAGLAKIGEATEGKRPGVVYYLGIDSLTRGANILRTMGKVEAAVVLENHLRKNEIYRTIIGRKEKASV